MQVIIDFGMTPTILYCLFALLFVIGAIELNASTRAELRMAGYAALLLLVLFSTWRTPGFGSDDAAYLEMFAEIARAGECPDLICGYSYATYNIEFGFFAMLLVLAQLGTFSFLLFGTVSLLSLSVNLIALRKFSPYVLPPVLVYFAHHYLSKELNALRLAISAAIVFYAAACCVERRYRRAVMLTIGGAFFQVSSMIALGPILLCAWVRDIRAITLLFATVVAVNLILPASALYEWFSIINFVETKMSLYMAADQYNYRIPLYDPVNLKNLMLVTLSLISYRSLEEKVAGFRVCFIFFGFATVFRLVFSDLAILAGRAFGVLSVFECALTSVLAVHYLGRVYGYLVVALYSLLLLSLNIFVNNQWRGGLEYFAL